MVGRASRVSFTSTIKSNRFRVGMGAFLVLLGGLALWQLRFGAWLVGASFDLPSLFAGGAMPEPVVIVSLDQESITALGGQKGQLPRSTHARLLDHLHADGARLVVFDIAFLETNAPGEDAALAEALRRCRPVVLDAERVASNDAHFPGERTQRPTPLLLEAAADWGIGWVNPDPDLVVRRLFTGINDEPSLAWRAAQLSQARLPELAWANRQQLWLRYYGSSGTIESVSYHKATNQPPGHYRGRVVFIGGKALPLPLGETSDLFRSPFTSWGDGQMPGVELVATMYLNLVHHDYLQRMSPWLEFGLLVLGAALFGGGLSLARPLGAVGLALGGIVLVAFGGLVLFWATHTWCAWMVVAGGQIPCALAWSVMYRTHRLSKAAAPAVPAPASSPPAGAPRWFPSQPDIPQHTLLRPIGEGAYGKVWLARDLFGGYHAVKVVYLAHFDHNPDPFHREFRGIKEYHALSDHPGLLRVSFVGECEPEGYFYYIMELGDDAKSRQPIDPQTYEPRNLEHDIKTRKQLPVRECIDVALKLASALDHLHRQECVHRDIKPSNIIFVKGEPKLADVGLVRHIVKAGGEVTRVGTPGYMPEKGLGTPAADIYGLGIVLYRMGTGLEVGQFPTLPATACAESDSQHLMRLNDIILTACAHEPAARYPSAAAFRMALLDLRRRLDGPPSDLTTLHSP